MRGADLLVRTLSAHGARTIFSLSGNQIMPVYDALVDAPIRLVHVRHEAAAVQMAESWAQVTGETGIALVTAGPGFANALSALYSARASETPLLFLSGDAPLSQKGLGAFQDLDQCAAAAPVAKATRKVAKAEDFGEVVAEALAIARSGRPGPVHLALPFDLLSAEFGSGIEAPAPLPPTARAISEDAARSIVEAIATAERPLILTGPMLCRHWTRNEVEALRAALDAPVIGLESPRGLSDPSLGGFGDLLPESDLVLLLGKTLDFAVGFGRDAPDTRFIQIDPEAGLLERSRAELGERLIGAYEAGAGESVASLTRAGARHGDADRAKAARADWRGRVADALAWRPDDWSGLTAPEGEGLHPLEVFRAVQAALDAASDPILVTDGGEFGQWALACLKARRWIKNGPAGAIGAALPYATAARIADPDATVVAISGDGSVGFQIAELDTAVRESAPFVAVVGNDARWNAEYQIQLRDYGPDRTLGCELRDTRYDGVAAGFGGFGARAEDASVLTAVLEQAFASGRPALVNVRLHGQPAPLLRRRANADDGH